MPSDMTAPMLKTPWWYKIQGHLTYFEVTEIYWYGVPVFPAVFPVPVFPPGNSNPIGLKNAEIYGSIHHLKEVFFSFVRPPIMKARSNRHALTNVAAIIKQANASSMYLILKEFHAK